MYLPPAHQWDMANARVQFDQLDLVVFLQLSFAANCHTDRYEKPKNLCQLFVIPRFVCSFSLPVIAAFVLSQTHCQCWAYLGRRAQVVVDYSTVKLAAHGKCRLMTLYTNIYDDLCITHVH